MLCNGYEIAYLMEYTSEEYPDGGLLIVLNRPNARDLAGLWTFSKKSDYIKILNEAIKNV